MRICLNLLALCASAWLGACAPQNHAECVSACEATQSQACLADVDLACDSDTTCPLSLDEDERDLTEYFTCVYGQYTCVEGEYVFVSEACTLPEA